MRKFFAFFKARTMEFVRDRGTLFWNLLFPVVLVFGFAFAFAGDGEPLFSVGILGTPDEDLAFMEIEEIEFIEYSGTGNESREAVMERLRRHQIDMLVDFEAQEFAINRESREGPVLRRLFLADSAESLAAGGGLDAAEVEQREPGQQEAAQQESGQQAPGQQAAAGSGAATFTEQEITGDPIRYVDWVVPGVLGMNMMFSCLFGVGFILVRYRKNGVLKRLKATPASPLTFLTAQAASRLVIVVGTSTFVYAGTNAFLQFTMLGSYLNLLLVLILAIACMIAIGLVVAGRLKSEELAGGLINLVTLPMIVLSGIFFSLEGAPDFLQTISRALPLTHFVDGARSIMLEGAGLLEIMPNLLYLGGLTLVFLALASALFRWE